MQNVTNTAEQRMIANTADMYVKVWEATVDQGIWSRDDDKRTIEYNDTNLWFFAWLSRSPQGTCLFADEHRWMQSLDVDSGDVFRRQVIDRANAEIERRVVFDRTA